MDQVKGSRSRLHRKTKPSFARFFTKSTVLTLTLIFLSILSMISFAGYGKVDDLQKRIESLELELSKADADCDEKEAIERAKRSVFRIVGGDGEGSGFLMDDYVITNFHVIEFESTPKVILPDNTFINAEIVMADKRTDLAFLKIQRNYPYLFMSNDTQVEQLDTIYALGYPFGGNLNGELTVKKGILSAKRFSKDVGIEYIQTDASLNSGMSGGPMLDTCGYVIGINTLGTAGLGLGISSASIDLVKRSLMEKNVDPLKDIKVLDIRENEDPLHTVQAFYDYIKLRRLDKAWNLLGEYKKDMKFENWKRGYEPNLDTTVDFIEVDEEDPNKILVWLSTKDMVDGDIVYHFYEGYWIVKEVDGKLLLWDPEIKETEPFYDTSWL